MISKYQDKKCAFILYIYKAKIFFKYVVFLMSKRKKYRFYLFRFFDYQMNYYEVEINWNKDYGALFDYYLYTYRQIGR